MATPEFSQLLAEAIRQAARNAELAAQQRAMIERAKRARSEQFEANKALACDFKRKHLENLFAETLNACATLGYRFESQHIHDDAPGRGITGIRLIAGKSADIAAAIQYTDEQLLLSVLAKPDDFQWPLYHETVQIEAANLSSVAVPWFQTHIPRALGMLIEHAAVIKARS